MKLFEKLSGIKNDINFCQYHYEESDLLVLLGEKSAGETCNRSTREGYDLCQFHVGGKPAEIPLGEIKSIREKEYPKGIDRKTKVLRVFFAAWLCRRKHNVNLELSDLPSAMEVDIELLKKWAKDSEIQNMSILFSSGDGDMSDMAKKILYQKIQSGDMKAVSLALGMNPIGKKGDLLDQRLGTTGDRGKLSIRFQSPLIKVIMEQPKLEGVRMEMDYGDSIENYVLDDNGQINANNQI